MPDLKPILLVEDSPKDVELTLSALERCQLANGVIVVRDGAEALDYLYSRGNYENRTTRDPAVVLLDLKLPQVDGLEGTPVVMLTSSREERDLVTSYNLGVNAFVVKPVGFDQFFEAIRDLGMFWAVLNEPPPPFGP
jgi:CheY-like chemotaxis protein